MRIVCPNCEAKLQVPALPEDDTALKCPKCKELFYPSVPDDDDEDRPAGRKKRLTRKKFPVVPVVCGVSAAVALIVVAVVLALDRGSKPTASKDDKPAATDDRGPLPKLPAGPATELRGLVDDLFKTAADRAAPVAFLPTLEADGDEPEVPPFAPPGAKGPRAEVPAGGTDDPAKVIESLKRSTVFIKLVGEHSIGFGSGFVVRAEGTTALVATNHHVIRRATEPAEADRPEVTVVFDSGLSGEQEVTAEVVAQDPDADLAILRVPGVRRMPAPIDPALAPRPTETTPVLICGFPLGTILGRGRNPNITVNGGTVSSVRLGRAGAIDQVQIDGTMNPGNSGGPIVEKSTGRLVGIAVAIIRPELGQGIGFAVPVPKLVALLGGKAHAPEFVGAALEGDEAVFRVEVPLADPLRQIGSVSLYVRTGAAPAGAKDPATGWKPMSGATKLELKLEPGKIAVGQLRLRAVGKETPLAVQLACTGPDGAVSVSKPAAYTLSREGVALAGEVVSMAELNRDPGQYTGKVVVVRGKMKPTANPRWNVFELDVTADNDVAPTRLVFLTGSDLEKHMKDLAGVRVAGPVQLTCRVGKAGADGVAPVRVTRIDLLLTATGKPVRSIPPDRSE